MFETTMKMAARPFATISRPDPKDGGQIRVFELGRLSPVMGMGGGDHEAVAAGGAHIFNGIRLLTVWS